MSNTKTNSMMRVRYNGLEKSIGYNPKCLSKPFYLTEKCCVNINEPTLYIWIVLPKDFKSDGCTIPFLFRLILGCPHTPKYVIASLIHDWIVENPKTIGYNRNLASRVFYTVLLQEGVNKLTAFVMYLGVDIWQAIKNVFIKNWEQK